MAMGYETTIDYRQVQVPRGPFGLAFLRANEITAVKALNPLI
jgi:hypothetical protein